MNDAASVAIVADVDLSAGGAGEDDTDPTRERVGIEATRPEAVGGDLCCVHALSLMDTGQRRNPCLYRLLYQVLLPTEVGKIGGKEMTTQ